jgi:hypothetical protein
LLQQGDRLLDIRSHLNLSLAENLQLYKPIPQS